MIGLHLINKDCALLPSVTRQVALAVAIDIELAHHPPSLSWTFPNRGTDSLRIPCHFPWETDVY